MFTRILLPITILATGTMLSAQGGPPAADEAPAAAPAAEAPAAAPAAEAPPAPPAPPVDDTKLESVPQKVGYAFGFDFGDRLKRANMEGIDVDALAAGLKASLAGKTAPISEDEMKNAVTQFQKKAQEAAMDKQIEAQWAANPELKAKAEANQKAGTEYLATNGKKEGVKSTESGLQYEIITAGTGPMPKAADEVTVNYKGTLIDGTEFDASEKHGGPATFGVQGVIAGWTEALQLMPQGSKWKLHIPSDLAYRKSGSGALIGPNAALVFEVELLKINGK